MKLLGIYAAVMLGLCWLAFLWIAHGDPVHATGLFVVSAIGGLIGATVVGVGIAIVGRVSR